MTEPEVPVENEPIVPDIPVSGTGTVQDVQDAQEAGGYIIGPSGNKIADVPERPELSEEDKAVVHEVRYPQDPRDLQDIRYIPDPSEGSETPDEEGATQLTTDEDVESEADPDSTSEADPAESDESDESGEPAPFSFGSDQPSN